MMRHFCITLQCFRFLCASGGAILDAQRYFLYCTVLLSFFLRLRRRDFRYTTILFVLRCSTFVFSRLRRGDFRYTTILFHIALQYFLLSICSRASGEATLGTQRYFLYCALVLLLIIFCCASGEAVLGTQRYFIKELYTNTLHKHFIQALYTTTLSNNFTQTLYPSTLHKHFIQALHRGIPNAFQKYLSRYYKGITTRQ